MLNRLAVRIHLIDVHAGDTRIVRIIGEKIHEVHVREYVIADGDDSVNDDMGLTPGAEAYRKDLKHVELHMINAGHFALETNAAEIAAYIRDFRATRE